MARTLTPYISTPKAILWLFRSNVGIESNSLLVRGCVEGFSEYRRGLEASIYYTECRDR